MNIKIVISSPNQNEDIEDICILIISYLKHKLFKDWVKPLIEEKRTSQVRVVWCFRYYIRI